MSNAIELHTHRQSALRNDEHVLCREPALRLSTWEGSDETGYESPSHHAPTDEPDHAHNPQTISRTSSEESLNTRSPPQNVQSPLSISDAFPDGGNSPNRVSNWWWWWELGAIISSITCVCLIVAVLVVIDGKPLKSWNHSISPNAVISVLATLGKSCLMLPVAACLGQLKWDYFEHPRRLVDLQSFDDATRGPWGSLNLLFNTKGRAPLAALGAIITIIALGYDPSAQQILAYPSRQTGSMNGTATIIKAAQYQMANDDSESTLAGGYAIMNGLVGGRVEDNFRCSTPECHFNPFTSLAMCSECQSITDSVHQRISTTHMIETGTGANLTKFSCTYTPPDDYYAPVTVAFAAGTLYEELSIDPGPQIGIQMSTSGWNHTNSSMGITFAHSHGPAEFTSDGKGYLPGPADVYTCRWSFCSQDYRDIVVRNGRLSFTSQSTPLVQRNHYEDETEFQFEGPPLELARPASPDLTEYTLEYHSTNVLWQYLGAQFSAPLRNTGALPFLGDGGSDGGVADEALGNPGIYGMGLSNLLVTSLLNAQRNVSDVVEGATRALNSIVQGSLNVNATSVTGDALIVTSFVHVRWPWLVLPVGLTLAAVILFAASIVVNSKAATVLLKSSLLAVLFHGLEGWREEELHPHMRADAAGLDKAARSMNVTFALGEGGVKKFIRVKK